MMKYKIITIDGPAASGKTSVSRAVARYLGWTWVSTGAFYRGLALVAQKEQMDLTQKLPLAELALSDIWRVLMAEDHTRVIYKSQDVTNEIYGEESGAAASLISGYSEVRKNLLAAQRACAREGLGLVAEGRDCGTIVFPKAQLKIYLTAKSDRRAARRAKEKGGSVAETKVAQSKRDEQDQTRSTAPLQIPEKAEVLDTSEMNLDQVIGKIIEIVKVCKAF